MIYQGQYWNGKRQGQGKEYVNHQLSLNCIWIKGYSSHRILRFSIIWLFICIIYSFCLIPSVGMTLLVTDFLLLWLFWRYNPVFSVVLRSVVKRSETTPRNNDSSSDPRIFTSFLNWLALIHILNSLVPVLIVISSFQKTQCSRELFRIRYNNITRHSVWNVQRSLNLIFNHSRHWNQSELEIIVLRM